VQRDQGGLTMTGTVDAIIGLLSEKGERQYGGEAVSQLEHALQCATLAGKAGESDALVAAALLHDIGHMLGKGDQGLAAEGIDARHEESAARWLARRFGPEVVEPVRLHVAAKRYLCRIDPGYRDSLSPASKRSLEVQGGVFSTDEAAAFAAGPHGGAAARLRRYDDLAKDPSAATPGLEHFRPVLAGQLLGD